MSVWERYLCTRPMFLIMSEAFRQMLLMWLRRSRSRSSTTPKSQSLSASSIEVFANENCWMGGLSRWWRHQCICMIILRTAAASTGIELANEGEQDSGILTDRAGKETVCRSDISFCIFPAKYSLKVSASIWGESCFERGVVLLWWNIRSRSLNSFSSEFSTVVL